MKAQVVSCVVTEGGIAAVHGIYYRINRLIVPEADDLVITPSHGSVYASSGRGIPEGEIVGEIDVAPELVQKAKELLEAKVALQALLGDETLDGHFTKQLTA
ncbi:MAG: hypothetical protein ACHQC8_05535 [Solirubrobacterales bacterium]